MVDAATQFIVDIFALLAAAVVAGEVAARLGQVPLVGQLLAGVVIGPTLLGPFIGLTAVGRSLTAVQTLAVIFVLFWAGLEVEPDRILEMGRSAVALGLAGFLIPFTALFLVVGPLLHLGEPERAYVALTLSMTALPVMGIMLSEFGLRGTKIGTLALNAAIINEFAAVSLFAILQEVGSSGWSSLRPIVIAVISLAIFLLAVYAVHIGLRSLRVTKAWPALTDAFRRTWRSKQGNFAILMVGVVGAALFSDLLGLTYVVGAFYAGLLVTRESAGPKAHESISSVFDTITWGFMIPLFFALAGVSMNLRLLGTTGAVAAFGILLVVAAVAKIGTGALIGSASGLRTPDALAIGHLINSRGAVELAMAVVLLADGIFNAQIFTLVVAIGLATTVVSPIGATRAWLSDPVSREEYYRRVEAARPGGASFARRRPIPPAPLDLQDT